MSYLCNTKVYYITKFMSYLCNTNVILHSHVLFMVQMVHVSYITQPCLIYVIQMLFLLQKLSHVYVMQMLFTPQSCLI